MSEPIGQWQPSNVSSKYGAPMGRCTTSERELRELAQTPVKLTLQRVRLNGDYDAGGAYWGQGEPLYRAADDVGGTVELFIRATSRADAKRQVWARLPKAWFYR